MSLITDGWARRYKDFCEIIEFEKLKCLLTENADSAKFQLKNFHLKLSGFSEDYKIFNVKMMKKKLFSFLFFFSL